MPDAIVMVGCRSQLMDAARELGLFVVIIVGPWELEHHREVVATADVSLVVDDPAKADLVLAALARHDMTDRSFAAVVPASDEYVVVCALLSGLVTRTPTNPWTALAWRDKSLQKRAVAAAGIPVASGQVIEDILDPPDDIQVRPPAVIKPLASAGAANLRLVGPGMRTADVLREISRHTPKRNFLIESFTRGTEYQIDAVVRGGSVEFVSVAEYLVNPLAALHGSVLRVATVDPGDDPALQAAGERLVRDAAAALGIVNSVLHLEAFRGPDGEMIFGECGVRLGGCFTPELVSAKYGLDLATIYLQLLIGAPVSLRTQVAPGVRCRALLPTKAGVLRAAPSASDLMRLPGVCFAEIQRPLGALLPPPTKNAVTRLGEIVVAGRDFAEVDQIVSHVVDWCLDRVTVTSE